MINCIASGLGRSLAGGLASSYYFYHKIVTKINHTSFYLMYVRFEDFASVALSPSPTI